jgi:ubiquinone/menaquinone biosynthesis C-methylase UbiE
MSARNREVNVGEGYAIWASFYDQEHNPLIMTEQPRVTRLLESLPAPATALDVATGTGRWAIYLAKRGVQMTAIDQSEEMLAVAREKAKAASLSISFHHADLRSGLPFPSGAFDLVVCALALSSFEDLSAPINECCRVVRPGGHLLITDFHPQAIKNGWEPTIFRGEDGYILPHPHHDVAEYLDAITENGCDLVHMEEILVREQPPESITAEDVDAFLAKHGDWPFCLIVLSRRR